MENQTVQLPTLKREPFLKKKTYLSIVAIITFVLITGSGLMLVNEWFKFHYFNFQSPIILQWPAEIKNRKFNIADPRPTQKISLIQTAYAAAPKQPELPPRAATLKAAVEKFGWKNFEAFELLIDHESGFRPEALNASSGACGIFQALPCSKLPSMAVDDQIAWGLNYITQRYGTPEKAWAFHQANNWY